MKARLTLLVVATFLAGGLLAQQAYYGSGYGTATLPVYAGGIAAAEPQPPPAGEPPAWAVKMQQDIDAIRKIVEAGGSNNPPPVGKNEAKPPPAAEDALVSAASKCVPCHVPGLPAKTGGGFVFFQKQGDEGYDMLPPATDADWSRLNRKVVVRHDMPPPVGSADNPNNVPPLTKEELTAFSKWLEENKPKK